MKSKNKIGKFVNSSPSFHVFVDPGINHNLIPPTRSHTFNRISEVTSDISSGTFLYQGWELMIFCCRLFCSWGLFMGWGSWPHAQPSSFLIRAWDRQRQSPEVTEVKWNVWNASLMMARQLWVWTWLGVWLQSGSRFSVGQTLISTPQPTKLPTTYVTAISWQLDVFS